MTNEVQEVDVKTKALEYKLDNSETVKLSVNIVRYNILGKKMQQIVTDAEIINFMNVCRYNRLNPFLNEVYLVKYGQEPAQIIVGKETYTKRAYNNPNFDGVEAGIIVREQKTSEIKERQGTFKLEDEELLGGWAKVYVKDKKIPFYVSVSMNEFKNSKSPTWRQMPTTMIRKTALVNALREAFPDAVQGVYTEDETLHFNNVMNNKNENKQIERQNININEIPVEEIIDEEEEAPTEIQVDPVEEKQKEVLEYEEITLDDTGIVTFDDMPDF